MKARRQQTAARLRILDGRTRHLYARLRLGWNRQERRIRRAMMH